MDYFYSDEPFEKHEELLRYYAARRFKDVRIVYHLDKTQGFFIITRDEEMALVAKEHLGAVGKPAEWVQKLLQAGLRVMDEFGNPNLE